MTPEQPNSLAPRSVPTLTDDQAAAVRALAAAAPGAADSPPLSDQTLLNLQSPAPVRHLLIGGLPGEDGAVRGYAQLRPESDGVTTEIVAAPDQASSLVPALLAAVKDLAGEAGEAGGPDGPDGADVPIELWAHGQASPLHAAAQAAGWESVRTLYQLRRGLDDLRLDAVPSPDVPLDGVSPGEPANTPAHDAVVIRPFRRGTDDEPWLAVNSRAFADFPDQGSWTATDLNSRLDADWFEPAGFLVAERDGALLGYHWTKVHTDALDGTGTPLGEVYVLGVDPGAQGLKLGRRLLTAGLAHLKGRGLRTVLLYVDSGNPKGLSLYRSDGFDTFAVDTLYRSGSRSS
ncbi:mycothiol synthase [Jatrophihabitans telluris]|uniref:Mycothiol acetyltransferase n=1 Tax=Jatrophihabitans telluris TaxID=2038343 RepID=A0ABY4R0I4_9ACTN|nr:mycothiol synthase [Jatrophihabitans telluris]UQX88776.1 mycothiol synthase [Jatrophihabitans telluris]